MIETPYTRPFGEVCHPEPQLDATPYLLFVLNTRLTPFLSRMNRDFYPNFQTFPINNQMRLVVQVTNWGQSALTGDQEERIQKKVNEIVTLFPNHCLLTEGTESELRQWRELILPQHEPLVWDHQLLIDLSNVPEEDFQKVYNLYIRLIYNPDEPLPQPLSDFLD